MQSLYLTIGVKMTDKLLLFKKCYFCAKINKNMKKYTLIIALCLVGIGAIKAQIIVSSTDFPVVGDKFVVFNDSNTTYTEGASGINVTWNYSFLADTVSTVDTITCVTPASTSYSLFFTGATLALKYSLGNLEYAFTSLNSNSMQLYGIVDNINSHPVPVVYRPGSQELYGFPMNYNSGWGTPFFYRVQLPFRDSIFDSIRVETFVHDTAYVDAWGNCTTPFGTFGTLRRRDIQLSIDSTFFKDTVSQSWKFIRKNQTIDTAYDWIAKGLDYPLLSMQIRKGHATVASWLKTLNAGISEISDKAGSLVYPNPASTELNIKLASTENGFVKVLDMTGREVSTTPFSNRLANINTAQLANGIYIYQVFDRTNSLVDVGKFSVAK